VASTTSTIRACALKDAEGNPAVPAGYTGTAGPTASLYKVRTFNNHSTSYFQQPTKGENMTNQSILSKLLRPFNMGPDEYRAMYASKPPGDLNLVLFLLADSIGSGHGDFGGAVPWFEDDPEAVLKALVTSCLTGTHFSNMDVEIILANEDDPAANLTDVITLEPIQQKWITHGVYPQLAFYGGDDYSLVDLIQPHAAFHTAMTVSDAMYAKSGSTRSPDHHPIPVTEADARSYRLLVGNIFEERFGIWCETLFQLRNEVLVRTHATIKNEADEDDRDPDVEWKKFCDAGLIHFLDYVKLLPE
jgi:hypothetical protein